MPANPSCRYLAFGNSVSGSILSQPGVGPGGQGLPACTQAKGFAQLGSGNLNGHGPLVIQIGLVPLCLWHSLDHVPDPGHVLDHAHLDHHLSTFTALHAVWVIVLANALVFTHMLSAVQLFTQPLYAAIEQGVARRWPWTPLSTSPRLTKLVWRSLYVALITFISALIPFFSQIIGLVGAVIYWPTAILFPVFVWLAVYPPHLSVRVGLQTLNAAMLIVAILAIVGSLRSIINNADTYGVFQ